MTASEIWNTALAVIASLGGGGAIVLALSSWLGKVWAARILESEKNRYAREIEAIRSSYSRELEQLKSELSRMHFDFQTRFGFYYQKRAESIMQIYGTLHMATVRMSDLVGSVNFGGKEALDEQFRVVQETFNTAAEEIYRRRIFLDEETADAIEKILQEMRKAFAAFRVGQDSGSGGGANYELLLKASQVMKEEVPPLLKNLERQFRASLEVQSPNDAQQSVRPERGEQTS